jgi:methyl-accepting chemotaxis protein
VKNARSLKWSVTAGLVVLCVVGAGFIIERSITTGAFDRLEAAQSAQDAQRAVVAIDGQLALLTMYGSSNSIWDGSYSSLKDGSESDFVQAFPPGQVRDLNNLAGIIGVSRDGVLRTGGLALGGSAYAPLPAGLARPAVLHQLYPSSAAAGIGRCGVVPSEAGPFLFCGYPAYDSAGTGAPSGDLVYFKSLGPSALSQLGRQVDLPVRLVAKPPPDSQRQPGLPSAIGSITVTTKALSSSRLAVDASLPTVGGGTIVLEITRPRPINETAGRTADDTLFLMAGSGLLLIGIVMFLVNKGTKEQVRPLRRLADAVIASGDLSLRVGDAGSGEIAALGSALDKMLDALEGKTTALDHEHKRREAQLADHAEHQQVADRAMRARAQVMIDDTISGVLTEMRRVLDQADALTQAASAIGSRASLAVEVTHTVARDAAGADRAVTGMSDSLQRVDSVASLISSIAAQTNLLALNATIEAARAGEAGRGFNVVAGQVKDLAGQTARSTEEITNTIAALGADAAAMSSTLTRLSSGVGKIDAANTEVKSVVEDQRASVEQLELSLREAINHIEAMSELAEKLERRSSGRLAVSSTCEVRSHGPSFPATVVNISTGGLQIAHRNAQAIKPGEVVEVDLTFDEDDSAGGREKLKASVAWGKLGPDGEQYCGLKFLEPSSRANARIDAHMTRLLGRARTAG